MPFPISPEEFDACVDDALATIPDELARAVENCVVLIEDEAPDDDPDLLGLYDGIPLTARDSGYGAVLPDRIFVFRHNLMDMCDSREELVTEIHLTVVHEVAHYFGIDDDRLHDLGYE